MSNLPIPTTQSIVAISSSEKAAWDMDGVFLEDLDGNFYSDNIEIALRKRDGFLPASYAPNVLPCDCIVTGRPIQDTFRTKEWLQRHGFNVSVYLRDDGIETPTNQTTAKWKGKKALELGCTYFVESDASQSVFIATSYPELRVIWWNAGNPVTIHTSKTAIPLRNGKLL